MRKTRTIVAIVLAVLLISSAAFATMAWMKVFKQTYNPKPGTALATAKCGACHTTPNAKGGLLNPYGASLKGKPINAASLKSIENQDADKDGFSNIAEIKAGTLPGDPNSHPAKVKPTKPVKPVKPTK